MSTKKFPFPMHPPELFPLFTGLCTPLSLEEIPILREKVIETARDIFEFNKKMKAPDVKTSYHLAEACHTLLDHYPKLEERAQSLAVGAVRYYIMRRDVHCDTKPVSGWEDDIAVVNYVLEEIGIEERFVA